MSHDSHWIRCYLLTLSVLAPPAAAVEIVSLQGEAEKRTANQTWQGASIHDQLKAGDQVRTLSLSRMGLLFDDQVQIRLGENSELTIKEPAADQSQNQTQLKLQRGLAWLRARQSQGRENSLSVETPAAVAAIRGTEWSLEIDDDDRVTLTVLRGVVDFRNDHGAVTVNANELATARPGQAPVKQILVNPRDRVQWVTAYRPQPLLHLPLARWAAANQVSLSTTDLEQDVSMARQLLPSLRNASQRRLLTAALAMADGDYVKASRLLRRSQRKHPVERALLRSELQIYRGQSTEAIEHLRALLTDHPDSDSLHRQLARLALLRGEVERGRHWLDKLARQTPPDLQTLLLQAEYARFEGQAEQASKLLDQAVELDANNPTIRFQRGRVANEREFIRQAISDLQLAAEQAPEQAQYFGELATAYSFANELVAASAAYEAAQQLDPDNYVSLTGKGILELKQGQTETALRTFLKASLIEPNYARAQLYMGIANYQLGRTATALSDLQRAAELDPLDPLPWLITSLIHNDQFEPRLAINASRNALARLPKLKSLNQLRNDQQGSANIGAAFAGFGLEYQAAAFGQESYSPYWGGSHLFLADRYNPDSLLQTSALYHGFITDPTTFGANPKLQTVTPYPGQYLSLNTQTSQQADFDTYRSTLTLNGYSNAKRPFAWFLQTGYTESHDDIPEDAEQAASMTGAIGHNPSPALGLFAFSSYDQLSTASGIKLKDRLLHSGGRYRFGPSHLLWLKFGLSENLQRQPLEDTEAGEIELDDGRFIQQRRNAELAIRHSRGSHRRREQTLGLEWAEQERDLLLASDSASDLSTSALFTDTTLSFGDIDKTQTLEAFYNIRKQAGNNWLLDYGLSGVYYQRDLRTDLALPDLNLSDTETKRDHFGSLHPRLGGRYQFAPGRQLRIAYQDWLRTAAAATLAPLTTAGIPLRDVFVRAGGRERRLAIQLEWTWSPALYSSVLIDALDIKNSNLNSDFVAPAEANQVGKLRRSRGSLTGIIIDPINQTPEFSEGRIYNLRLVNEALLNRHYSLFATYDYFLSRDRSPDQENPSRAGREIPGIARHLVTVGGGWVSPAGLAAIVVFDWSDQSIEDYENNVANISAGGYSDEWLLRYESPLKHFEVQLFVDDLLQGDANRVYGSSLEWRP